jgi:hypothetical protein
MTSCRGNPRASSYDQSQSVRLVVLLGQTCDTYSLDCSPLLGGHAHHMSAWWNGAFFIVLSHLPVSSGLEDLSDNSFGVCSKLLQQRRICRGNLLDQRLRHLRVLSHNLAHIRQLSWGKLGHSSASTTESWWILLSLLLLLLGKLEEISGSGLLNGLLSRGWGSGRFLGQGLWRFLSGLLSRWWWGQLGLNMGRNTLIQNKINNLHTCDGDRGFTYGHQIFHGAIRVVETGSHGPLNFLARKTHINDAVNRGRECGTGQETATRTTCCLGWGGLLCRRLSRLRGGFGDSGLGRLIWLGRLCWLDWLRRFRSAGGSGWGAFWLGNRFR